MTPIKQIVETLLIQAGWPHRDRWLAQLVVMVVEERTKYHRDSGHEYPQTFRNKALSDPDIDITLEQFAEIRNRLAFLRSM